MFKNKCNYNAIIHYKKNQYEKVKQILRIRKHMNR